MGFLRLCHCTIRMILGALWIVSTVVSAAGSVHIHVEAPVPRLCKYVLLNKSGGW
jgi:hypothetical protein